MRCHSMTGLIQRHCISIPLWVVALTIAWENGQPSRLRSQAGIESDIIASRYSGCTASLAYIHERLDAAIWIGRLPTLARPISICVYCYNLVIEKCTSHGELFSLNLHWKSWPFNARKRLQVPIPSFLQTEILDWNDKSNSVFLPMLQIALDVSANFLSPMAAVPLTIDESDNLNSSVFLSSYISLNKMCTEWSYKGHVVLSNCPFFLTFCFSTLEILPIIHCYRPSIIHIYNPYIICLILHPAIPQYARRFRLCVHAFNRRKSAFWQTVSPQIFRLWPEYVPLNHGSFGASPTVVADRRDAELRELRRNPDKYLRYTIEDRLNNNLDKIAPLLGITDPKTAKNVVFINNATMGVNTVLRSYPFKRAILSSMPTRPTMLVREPQNSLSHSWVSKQSLWISGILSRPTIL